MANVESLSDERINPMRGFSDPDVKLAIQNHLDEIAQLREGLRQIIEGDYPAPCSPEEWAEEVLHGTNLDWETTYYERDS
jgi:hypothetical protein